MNVSAASSAADIPKASRARSAPPSAERFRLVGPTIRLDPRVNAVRRDIADIALASHVFAPHYARPEICICLSSAAMLREAPASSARAVSQILHGEAFAMIDVAGGWAWGYGLHDRYVGYLPADAIGPAAEPSHIVGAAQALLFAAADIKSEIVGVWPIGARFAATDEGDFLATEHGFLHRRHARPIAAIEADPVAVAERLIGAPYRWGGRGGDGVDCSGLVQLALGLTGIEAPRDSDQQRALGDEIAPDAPLQRGDLIFFPGHVGFMTDGAHMVHANAHWMAVTVEPLAQVVARLTPLYAEPIVARRRIG